MSDINIGAITEALNDKTDRDMRNVDNTAGADAVIEYQEPNAGNSYTWYRKYKSGWVEQGLLLPEHIISAGYGANDLVALPVEMADTDYDFSFGPVLGSFITATAERYTTNIRVYQYNRSSSEIHVRCVISVRGKAA